MKKLLTHMTALLLLVAGVVYAGPKAVPINLNIQSKNAYAEAVVTREEKGEVQQSGLKIWKLGNNYRIEAATQAGPLLLIINSYTLYVVSGEKPSALAMDVMSPEAEVFLKKVFINTGKGRHPLSGLPPETVAGKKCEGAKYALLKNASGIYCRAELYEWRTKKSMTLMKAITETAPCEMGSGKGKLVFDRVKETFEIKKLQAKWFMNKKLLDLPQGCEVQVITGTRG